MKKITLFTLLTLLLCTSCVTKKKFMLAEMAATASKDSLQGLLNNSREVGNQLSAQVKNLLRDTTKMGNSIRQYQSMLNVNMTEQEKLNALLSQKKNELNERERTINELQDMIKAQNDKVQNLLSNVKDALLGFSTDELTVREKDGKVYVTANKGELIPTFFPIIVVNDTTTPECELGIPPACINFLKLNFLVFIKSLAFSSSPVSLIFFMFNNNIPAFI